VLATISVFFNKLTKGILSQSISIEMPGMVASTSEAARLIKQGGVKIDSKKVEDPKLEIKKGSEAIYQVGKRKFLKIKLLH
jgi:tyrosyl-tRNA synthetase